MELQELKSKFERKGFNGEYGETIEHTFAIVGTSEGNPNLTSNINRNNSGWPKAKYIILKEEVPSEKELNDVKVCWSKVNGTGKYNKQFLVFKMDDEWNIIDNMGKFIGGEELLNNLLWIDTGESKQKIFYGAPGTGKSHEVKKITGELEAEERGETLDNVFRTTFHPDTDYASFVGCYKPTMRDTGQVRIVNGKTEKVEEISYEFVPQTFTDAYVYAYKHPDTTTYLVIEEINRGNCAQIFGDLFQLLDRKEDGTSEYRIKADKDLAKHLIKELQMPEDTKPENVKLCLPANLLILATMNTSDQSLFPMDSAFKRRWDWEYVPISYTEEKSSAFEIEIGGEKYSWVKFIEAVNKRIFDLTQSEDKEMGNFFIKSSVDARQFKSKVMFYLWNEVLRDEVENQKYFFYATDEDGTKRKFTFKDLYEENATETLKGFMRYLDVEA